MNAFHNGGVIVLMVLALLTFIFMLIPTYKSIWDDTTSKTEYRVFGTILAIFIMLMLYTIYMIGYCHGANVEIIRYE